MNDNRAVTFENNYGNKTVLVFNKNVVQDAIKIIEESAKEYGTQIKTKVYDLNYENVPLEFLPESIQEEVKQTLKCFGECHVEYSNCKFSVNTVICLKSSYSPDECVIGVYKAKEVYTKEELRAAHKEVFGYAF